jgi:hypothetical protein
MTNHQVIVSHGLGNQLFQYAFAHHLALQQGCKVFIENSPIVSKLGGGKSEVFQLFDLLNSCDHLHFKKNFTVDNYSFFGRFLFKAKLADCLKSLLVKSRHYQLDLETRNTSFKFFGDSGRNAFSPTSFQGFWQNWRYVEPNSDLIFSEVNTFISEMVPDALQINHSNLLVCHVRRGDFLIRNRSKELGIIPLSCYIEKINQIKVSNPDIQIITFTDSKDCLTTEKGCEKMGLILGPSYDSHWQILKTMSLADFVIAGNSSFSWWGSFLCLKNGGVPYIPEKFYFNLDTFDAFHYPGFQRYENCFEI